MLTKRYSEAKPDLGNRKVARGSKANGRGPTNKEK